MNEKSRSKQFYSNEKGNLYRGMDNRDLPEALNKSMKEALSRELEINAALAELSRRLLSAAIIDDVSDMVLDHAKNLTESLYGFVGYIDTRTGFLVCPTMTRDAWDACKVRDKRNYFSKFTGLWGWVLNNRKATFTNNVAEDPRSVGIPPGHVPIQRFLAAPALIKGKLVGLVALANSGRDYTQEDLDIIQQLADIFAVAILRMRTEDELRKHRQSLERMVAERTQKLEQANEMLQKEIEERKKAEEGLEESLSLIRAIFDAAFNGVAATDASGKVRIANRKMSEMWRMPEDLLLSGDNNKLVEIVREQISDSDSIINRMKEIFSAPNKENNGEVEFKDGRIYGYKSLPWRLGGEIMGNVWIFSDVTEQRRAARALQESEQKFRELFHNASDMIILCNIGEDIMPGAIIEVNDTACRVLGYEREELLSIRPADIIVPEDRDMARKTWEASLESGSGTFETMLVSKAGNRIPVEISLRIFDLNGTMVFLSIARNILNRKITEEVLRENAEHCRTLMEASPDAIVVVDMNTNIIKVNRKAVELYGAQSPEDLIGQKGYDFLIPDKRRLWIEKSKELLKRDALSNIQYPILRKDGSELLMEVSCRLIKDIEGRPHAIICFCREVTGRKRFLKVKNTRG